MSVSDTNEASVDVTNTCPVPGDAVAKIYVHLHYRSASRPVRQFKGFERIALQPGETKTLTFPLGTDQLYFWDPQSRAWVVEPCEFDVRSWEDSSASLRTEFMTKQ